jgi:ketosteroid isomerase-like protein
MSRIFFLTLFLVIFQSAAAQKNNQQQIEIIRNIRMESNACIARHNADEMSKFLTDDFAQVRGNSTHLSGKDTIVAAWKELFLKYPKVSYVREPSEILISDNDTLAWETGKWKAINSYSKGGNYSAMWRKSNGNWKIRAELFVSLND